MWGKERHFSFLIKTVQNQTIAEPKSQEAHDQFIKSRSSAAAIIQYTIYNILLVVIRMKNRQIFEHKFPFSKCNGHA